jgi:DNA (cytosine-5)-methyltransferase 1
MEQAGHKCIGYIENNDYSRKSYQAIFDTKGEWTAHDISSVDYRRIPRADCWCLGFPCQDISVGSNSREGLSGARSGLFYTVIELIKSKDEKDKPELLFIENVKNLFSVNNGWDFARVLISLDEAGYDAEWELLDTKDFGLPQRRERVFIIGHLRGRSSRKVFPLGRTSANVVKRLVGGSQGLRVYDPTGVSCTLNSGGGGLGGKTGLYLFPVQTPERTTKSQNGRRIKNHDEPMYTLTAKDQHGVLIQSPESKLSIRKLTPRETWRLQGFPDWAFDRARLWNTDTQLYRQAGNTVSIPVVYEIAKRF